MLRNLEMINTTGPNKMCQINGYLYTGEECQEEHGAQKSLSKYTWNILFVVVNVDDLVLFQFKGVFAKNYGGIGWYRIESDNYLY